MLIAINLLRRFAVRALAVFVVALAVSAAGFAQQITCPVASDTTNTLNTAVNSAACAINSSVTLTNNGVLTNELGGALTINGTFNNNGTLVNQLAGTIVNNATVYNNGFITNDSSSTFTNNGSLNIAGGATLSNFGTFNGTGTIFTSGTVDNLSTGTLNNAIFTFGATVANGGGSLQLASGSTINGGTLNNALPTGFLGATGAGTLVLLNGNATLGAVNLGPVMIQGTYTSDVGTTTQLNGPITNQGNIQLNSGTSDTHLTLVGDTTFQGGGTVTLANSGGLGTTFIDGTHVLTNVDNTIQGTGAIGPAQLINQGTINANVSNQVLSLGIAGGANVVNTGLLEATGGGTLQGMGGTITNTGGTIAANGGRVELDGGWTITGGTITALNGGDVALGSLTTVNGLISIEGATLDNVSGSIGTGGGPGQQVLLDGSTAAGAVTIQGLFNIDNLALTTGTITNQGTVQIGGTLALLDNTILQGGGALILGNNGRLFGAESNGLTLTNMDNTIQGSGAIVPFTAVTGTQLVNQTTGTINANVSGLQLFLDNLSITNSGLMEATNGGTLGLASLATLTNNSGGLIKSDSLSTIQNDGILTNAGTINNAGTLNGIGVINTSGTVNNSGNFSNAVLNFAGTINNTGGTLLLANGSTINGGTLNNVSGTLGVASGATALLDGSTGFGAMTIQGTFTGGPNTTTQLNGTIINQGNILQTNADLTLVGDTTLKGGGTVTLSTAILGGTHVLTNVDNTIQGAGTIGDVFGIPTLVNQAAGTINANVSGGTLNIGGVSNTSTGLMEATGGGTLLLETTLNNNGGLIETDSLSTITNNSTLTNAGTINNAGTFNGTGAIFNFAGTINNTGGTLLLANGSTIDGGTLNNASGTLGVATAATVLLDGSTGFGAVTIQGTFTGGVNTTTQLNGTIINQGNILQTNADLTLVGDTTLKGAGTVTLSTAILGGAHVLTNVDNTIQGAGQIGDIFGNPTLVNQAAGTINANVSGGTLAINSVSATNAGLMEATNGGALNLIASPLTNAGTVLVDSLSTLNTNSSFTQTGGKTQVDGVMTAAAGLNVTGGSVLGKGTINGNVAMTGGAMQPGGLIAPGTLTINGNFTHSNAFFNELIGASGNGLLVVNGAATLGTGSLLNINLVGSFTPFTGETFTIMDFNSLTGTFANAPTTGFQMDGFDWTIAYNANDIVIDVGSAISGGGGGGGGGGTTSTPEPSSLILLSTGLGALFAFTYLRKRVAATQL